MVTILFLPSWLFGSRHICVTDRKIDACTAIYHICMVAEPAMATEQMIQQMAEAMRNTFVQMFTESQQRTQGHQAKGEGRGKRGRH